MNKTRKKALIFLIVSLLLLLFVLYSVGFKDIAEAIKEIKYPLYLVGAIACTIVLPIIKTQRWNFILRNQNIKVPFRKLIPMTLAGLFINHTTPSGENGGEPLRAYYLSKLTKKDLGDSFGTIMPEKYIELMFFAVLASVSLIGLVLFYEVHYYLMAIILGAFAFMTFILILMIYLEHEGLRKFNRFLDRVLPKIYHFGLFKFIRRRYKNINRFEKYAKKELDEFYVDTVKSLKDKHLILKLIFTEIVIWTLVYLKIYLVFLVFGFQPPFLPMLIAYNMGMLVGILSFVPGGVGIIESTTIILFTILGIGPVGVVAIILTKLIDYAVWITWGYMSLMYLGFKQSFFQKKLSTSLR